MYVYRPVPPFHLFRGAGLEKRRGEQLKWFLAFRHRKFSMCTATRTSSYSRLGLVFCVFSSGLCFVFFCAFWFVCVSPFFYVSLSSWVISLTVFGASVTSLNKPPRALAASTTERVTPSLLGRCKQKQRGLRGLLCRWPSITEWEVHITAQGPPSPKWPILCRVGR